MPDPWAGKLSRWVPNAFTQVCERERAVPERSAVALVRLEVRGPGARPESLR